MISLWQDGVTLPSFSSLTEDTKTNVLIIGGGMAGILTAYLLQKQGIPYLLVEKDRIGNGITKNTTAKITFQHGLLYHRIVKSDSYEKAKLYLNANRIAFSRLVKLCQKIDCDYAVKDNFVYTVGNRKKLENEMETLLRIGYHPKFHENLPLPIETAGAVSFADQAEFHLLKFLATIAKDLNIRENTFVREMVGNTAVTDHGRITAERVIVTTHFPFINKHGSYFLKLYQHRSYVIALENAQNVGGMYVDDDQKGLSFRNHQDLLLLGGGSHRTGKKGGNWEELRGVAKAYYPNAEEKYRWATQDCMSLDSLPYIGRYSKHTPNLFVASGFNKWGMTGSMLSALLLCDLVSDKHNDFEKLFSPSRSMMKPQLAINTAESIINLLTPTRKRCPHLGCALKYNAAEHSWDCPCHGSRFSENGKLLENPANGDMKKKH